MVRVPSMIACGALIHQLLGDVSVRGVVLGGMWGDL